ncbi:hypothetical protein OO184_14010 [Photorhabdus sp. APURE]|uniref:hypothetical protein n=1 Tax=Photorhabdus aballayi TaxID=2991723 RepID=UPI00223E2008|nr:hypothetical protein [Photorhabdus aballayi]MCW7549018.1 hypothetical protein [Photorhabdus aballayi]
MSLVEKCVSGSTAQVSYKKLGSLSDFTTEKVVADNNALSLPKGMADYGRSASSLAAAMLNEGKSPQEISAALSKHAKGDHPEGQDPARGLLVAWGAGASAVGGTIVAPVAGTAAVVGGALLGAISDTGKQLITMKPNENYSYTDTLIAAGVGALTQGKGLIYTEGVNIGGAWLGSKLKGEDATGAVIGAAVGTVAGAKGGKIITDKLAPVVISPVASEIGGAIGGTVVGTVIGTGIENQIKENGAKNGK